MLTIWIHVSVNFSAHMDGFQLCLKYVFIFIATLRKQIKVKWFSFLKLFALFYVIRTCYQNCPLLSRILLTHNLLLAVLSYSSLLQKKCFFSFYQSISLCAFKMCCIFCSHGWLRCYFTCDVIDRWLVLNIKESEPNFQGL